MTLQHDRSDVLALMYERLAAGSPGEVREAASAIAELRDPRSLGPLLEALRRAEGDEKCHLARALGTLGDARALPPLLGLMSYGLCETAVLEALGRIGDGRALGALVKALTDERTDICSAAIEALGALGDPRTEDALRACLDRPDADPAMQLRVERALAAIAARGGRST
jgi:HEAT repeat protein